ncbi:MAG: hypothetical protein NC548_25710 [Lachnospiraceae bacterium]|nr:hypothetical protein [Lachnospiraceae bacterium]
MRQEIEDAQRIIYGENYEKVVYGPFLSNPEFIRNQGEIFTEINKIVYGNEGSPESYISSALKNDLEKAGISVD